MDRDNPYVKILNLMQIQGQTYNPPAIEIGEVISGKDEPLTVKIGDLQLTKEDMLIADYLLKGYKRAYMAEGDIDINPKGQIKIPSIKSCGDTEKCLATTCSQGTLMHDHKIKEIKIQSDDFSIKGKLKAEGKGEEAEKDEDKKFF